MIDFLWFGTAKLISIVWSFLITGTVIRFTQTLSATLFMCAERDMVHKLTNWWMIKVLKTKSLVLNHGTCNVHGSFYIMIGEQLHAQSSFVRILHSLPCIPEIMWESSTIGTFCLLSDMCHIPPIFYRLISKCRQEINQNDKKYFNTFDS